MPVPTPVPAPLSRRPFTIAEAASYGLTPKMLRSRRFRRVFCGVYVTSQTELTSGIRTLAAIKVAPKGAVVSKASGLRMYGAPISDPPLIQLESVHVHQRRRGGIAVSRVDRTPPSRGAIALPAHCFVTSCADLDLVTAVIAGDALIHLRRVTKAQLETYAQGWSGRGVVRARRAAALVRERVESPRETRLRLLLVLAGLPTPDTNVTLGDADGPIGRVDLLFWGFMLIVEYDGLQHLTDRRQWNRDIERLEGFADAGYTVIRVTADRMRQPREVVRRVFEKLVQAGYEGPPPTFTAEWSAFFE